ncbi:MAG: FG-GAP-like repeat-containing protein [Acidobacteriota bacterium]
MSSKVCRTLFSLLLFSVSLSLLTTPAWADVPFGSSVDVDTGLPDARDVVTADFDRDGDLDLLGAIASVDDVVWWENALGDGSTWSRHDLNLNADLPLDVEAADLDGDGDLDALAAVFFDGAILWWENDIDSGLACGTDFCEATVSAAASGASDVAVADVDRDGDLDVVAALRLANQFVWYKNDGSASSWTSHVIASAIAQAQAVALADLDGDGDLDVLGGSASVQGLVWFENNLDGAGACAGAWCQTTLDADFTGGVASADLDGDGDQDLLQTGNSGVVVSWWENTVGDASAWSEQPITLTASSAVGVSAVDLDSDGDLDVLVQASGAARWLENSAGDGTVWAERIFDLDDDFLLTAGDLDGDGDLDVTGAGDGVDAIRWWPNETLHRSALYVTERTILASGDDGDTAILVDVDLDGDQDLVADGGSPTSVLWMENDGTPRDGGWSETTIQAVDFALGLAAEDLDQDGDPDLIATLGNPIRLSWLENPADPVHDSWTERELVADLLVIGTMPDDVDRDGDPDLVLYTASNELLWLENDGNPATGVWTLTQIITSGLAADPVLVDLDRDGDHDLVGRWKSDLFSAAGLVWWENDGTPEGPDWTRRDVAAAFDAENLAVGDVDGDGDPDIMAVDDNVAELVWFESDGSPLDGGWTRRVADTAVVTSLRVRLADADRDGDLDLFGAEDADSAALLWWENDGSPSDGGWVLHPVANGQLDPENQEIGDVDGDGDLDWILAQEDSGEFTWWENQGGQFALPTLDAVAEPTPNEGAGDVLLLRIDGAHRGRSRDGSAELATLELRFEDDAADPLTDAELNVLVDRLRLYLDDGDGEFEPGGDDAELFVAAGPFAPTEGVLTLTLVDGDPALEIAVGVNTTWWLAADFASNAGSQAPDSFQVSHLTSASSTGEMATTDLPLSLEFAADVASSVLAINGAPAVEPPIADQVANAGALFELDVAASFFDFEPGALTYSATGLPDSMSITGGGFISGMPTLAEAAASPYSVMVTATDAGGLMGIDTFSLSVDPFGGTIVIDGVCTLSDAILSANSNSDVGACTGSGGVETLVLDSPVTLTVADTVNSSAFSGDFAGLPDVTSELVIAAGTASLIERDSGLGCVANGPDFFRLFNVLTGGRLILRGLTLQGGCAGRGGAIAVRVEAGLELEDCRLIANQAQASPGSSTTRGGAVFAQKDSTGVVVTGTLFADNRADAAATVDVAAEGGALYLEPNAIVEATIAESTFRRNQALGGAGQAARGGAIAAGVVTLASIVETSFEENLALGGDGNAGGAAEGGALFVAASTTLTELVFVGNSAVGGDGTGDSGGVALGGAVFREFGSSPVAWSGLVFERNQTVGGNSTSAAGGGAQGGALSAVDVDIERAFFELNSSFGGSGVTGGFAAAGGAQVDNGGSLRQVSFVGNRTRGGDGTSGDGGGANGGALRSIGELEVTAATASENEVRAGDSATASGGQASGGGMSIFDGSLSHVTVTGNRVIAGSGGESDGTAVGGGVFVGSVFPFDNSILAGNTRADGGGSPIANDCFRLGVSDSQGFNLVEAPDNCDFSASGDQTGLDPLLGALRRMNCSVPLPNGLCLPVQVPDIASPALDQGSCVVSTATEDARGFARPFDNPGTADAADGCDIGAVEYTDANDDGLEDGREIFGDGFESGDTAAWSQEVF